MNTTQLYQSTSSDELNEVEKRVGTRLLTWCVSASEARADTRVHVA